METGQRDSIQERRLVTIMSGQPLVLKPDPIAVQVPRSVISDLAPAPVASGKGKVLPPVLAAHRTGDARNIPLSFRSPAAGGLNNPRNFHLGQALHGAVKVLKVQGLAPR
jgi:hypothetical protein